MRLKFTLRSASKSIQANFYYHFSAAIYDLLRLGSPEFSEFLHNKGYRLESGKNYKLFSFGVEFSQIKVVKDHFYFIDPATTLYVSSPKAEEFFTSFVLGTLNKSIFKVGTIDRYTTFIIEELAGLGEPEIKESMNFRLLAPMVISKPVEYNGKQSTRFLRPDEEEEASRILSQNLINKHLLITGEDLTGKASVVLEWDKDYIRRRDRVTKKITVNPNSPKATDVIGILAPFKITGDVRLIKAGYDCGFGNKNSMGFGLAQIKKEDK
ncbi:MAG: CRISPR-associated endoribonuclease Cas6 [Bacteroidetes bacterium]|nr:CRISPR-associated endoribonuclease Cas6 [Bacteroidota bacterium]